MSCAEIAAALGTTEKAVECLLARVMRKVREALLKVDADPVTWRTW
jgi:DNA-directed RNA polymerase specialized sigma24 family protein